MRGADRLQWTQLTDSMYFMCGILANSEEAMGGAVGRVNRQLLADPSYLSSVPKLAK
jgi:phage-related minor tail protein